MALRRGGWTVGRTEWKELFAPERLVRRIADFFPPEVAGRARRRRDLWL